MAQLSEAKFMLWTMTLDRPEPRQLCHLPSLAPFLLRLSGGHLFRETGREATRLGKEVGMWFQVGWGQSGLAEWSLVICSPELETPLKTQKLLSLREATDLPRVTYQLRVELRYKIR